MCMTLKLPESERKRQDRFVRRAEKRVCSTKLTQRRGPIHPQSSVPATSSDAWRPKRLISRKKSSDLDIKRQATWGMSGKVVRCGESALSGL